MAPHGRGGKLRLVSTIPMARLTTQRPAQKGGYPLALAFPPWAKGLVVAKVDSTTTRTRTRTGDRYVRSATAVGVRPRWKIAAWSGEAKSLSP
jgi:hypothetical protein